jgi:Na(+)-translocating NADH:ubiquinone oxidoreductase A subunit
MLELRARRKSFKGGYLFKPFKGEIENRSVTIPVPRTAVMPLRQGYGREVSPVVNKGDTVKAGQIIGRDDDSCSTPVVSSVNGTVREIGAISLQDGDVTAIVIDSDGSPRWEPMPRGYTDYKSASVEEIERLLYEGGITALGPWGLPTSRNTAAVEPGAITKIIITALPTEPFLLTNQVLLSNALRDFAIGCEILRRLYKPGEMHLVMSSGDQMRVQKMRSELAELKMSIHELAPRHPQSYEEIAVESCLGMTVPDRVRAIDMGVLVVDAQIVLHIHDAIVEGKPLIERIVSLGGGAFSEPCAAVVTVGTLLRDVVSGRIREGVEPRLVLNSSLTGAVVSPDTPVDRTLSAVIALEEYRDRPFMHFVRPGVDYDSKSNSFLGKLTGMPKRSDTNLGGELRACINCAYCEDVCPRDLMPHHLSKRVRANLLDEAETMRLFGCIECGLCSYVCPSKIPLMDDIIRGKREVVREEEEYQRQLEAAEEERVERESEAEKEGAEDA